MSPASFIRGILVSELHFQSFKQLEFPFSISVKNIKSLLLNMKRGYLEMLIYIEKLENMCSLISVFCFRSLKITISHPFSVIIFL